MMVLVKVRGLYTPVPTISLMAVTGVAVPLFEINRSPSITWLASFMLEPTMRMWVGVRVIL